MQINGTDDKSLSGDCGPNEWSNKTPFLNDGLGANNPRGKEVRRSVTWVGAEVEVSDWAWEEEGGGGGGLSPWCPRGWASWTNSWEQGRASTWRDTEIQARFSDQARFGTARGQWAAFFSRGKGHVWSPHIPEWNPRTYNARKQSFLHVHTQNWTHTLYLMQNPWIHRAPEHSLICHTKGLCPSNYCSKYLSCLRALDRHSSVPPQEIHCLCWLDCDRTEDSHIPGTIPYLHSVFQDVPFGNTDDVKKLKKAGNSWKVAGWVYYRPGKAWVKLMRVIQVVQIKQTRAFMVPPLRPLLDAKHNTGSTGAAQPDSQLYALQFWQNRVTRRYEEGFLGKIHTSTHNSTQTALFGAAGGHKLW